MLSVLISRGHFCKGEKVPPIQPVKAPAVIAVMNTPSLGSLPIALLKSRRHGSYSPNREPLRSVCKVLAASAAAASAGAPGSHTRKPTSAGVTHTVENVRPVPSLAGDLLCPHAAMFS